MQGATTPLDSVYRLSTFLCERNLIFTKLTKVPLSIFMKEEICRLRVIEIW